MNRLRTWSLILTLAAAAAPAQAAWKPLMLVPAMPPSGALTPEGCYMQAEPLAVGLLKPSREVEETVCVSGVMASHAPGDPVSQIPQNVFAAAPMAKATRLTGKALLRIHYRNDAATEHCYIVIQLAPLKKICTTELHYSLEEHTPAAVARVIAKGRVETRGDWDMNQRGGAGDIGYNATHAKIAFPARTVPAGNRLVLRLQIQTPPGSLSAGRLLFGGPNIWVIGPNPAPGKFGDLFDSSLEIDLK